ncbi:MAG: hypothetical protein ACK5JT_02925 [Hyphomicrobiaceae bacterium]
MANDTVGRKSNSPPPPAPSVVRASSLDTARHRSILADITIEYGPRDLLNRLFLQADTKLREQGIVLGFGTFEELHALNRQNSDSWRPLLPLFRPDLWQLDDRNGVVFFGRDATGRIVYSNATRAYDLAGGTLKDKIESNRIFYPDPEAMAWEDERMIATAPIAAKPFG